MNEPKTLSLSDLLPGLLPQCADRYRLMAELFLRAGVRQMAEIGVFKGEFAERMLRALPEVERYYLLDPWRNLADWNKPANRDDDTFQAFYREALDCTAFAGDKRQVLRGTTLEVIDEIEDGTLDAIYIDGDHTLKGISIDLMCSWDKVRDGGLVCGDDFTPSIWQHGVAYEPTMVFPMAVYFAEAMGCPVHALPHRQFVIHKNYEGYAFTDHTGKYRSLDLLWQMKKWQRKQQHGPKRKKSILSRIRGRLARLGS